MAAVVIPTLETYTMTFRNLCHKFRSLNFSRQKLGRLLWPASRNVITMLINKQLSNYIMI